MEDTTIEDVLKTVEALHNQKDYEGALRVLKDHQETISSALWHYNMGVIQAKLNHLPEARYHLLMAEKSGLASKELYQNQDLIETKLEIPRLEKALSATDYVIKGSLVASQGIFTFLGLLFIIAGILSLRKKLGLTVFFSSIGTAIVLLAINFWVHSWDQVIVLENSPLREGPSAIFEAREELPAGVKIIVKREGEWLKVVYPSRFEGWIKDQGLKELK